MIAEIQRIKDLKKEFDARKKFVLENNEEWTEGEFSQIIPDELEKEVNNDID